MVGSDGVTPPRTLPDGDTADVVSRRDGDPDGDEGGIDADASPGDSGMIGDADRAETDPTGVPPIDRDLPERIETATFAFG